MQNIISEANFNMTECYEEKIWTVIINNSTNINKTNTHVSTKTIAYKQTKNNI
jgi:hypothetical protein